MAGDAIEWCAKSIRLACHPRGTLDERWLGRE